MIKVQNLTKVYKSKKRSDCKALDNVSFDLPDKGLIFIIGKSGSGKSTLLNILGGLDSATDGELFLNGNAFSSFTTAEQDNYRNLHVGFVFQDFCLLDGLTVTDNVRLSLDLLGESNDTLVKSTISDVGLTAESNRYPRELSGGQCQRVAIARAIVKSPKLLLADEPTGNLDSKTATQILQILKELSRERLIVVVSHNTVDANYYGDRIIELADGKIIRDVERSEERDFPLISDNLITLPRGKALTESDLVAINEKITQDGVSITQAPDPFVPTNPDIVHEVRPLGSPKKMKKSASFRINKFFAKGGYLGTAVTALMLTVLALILCFAQAFSFFDSSSLIAEALDKSDNKSFSMHKGYYEDKLLSKTLEFDKAVPITEEDISAFYDAGYDGKTYLLYPTTTLYEYKPGASSPLERGEVATTVLDYESPYAKYGNGVLETEESFLIKLYGKDGKLSLLGGKIDEQTNNTGVVITDYAADCILHYNKVTPPNGQSPYETIVNMGYANTRTNISAVIDTGYKERYAEVFTAYETFKTLRGDELTSALEEFLASEIFEKFSTEVDKYLAIGYFLGEDYKTAVLSENYVAGGLPRFHQTDICSVTGEKLKSDCGWMYSSGNFLNKGEAMIGADVFNEMFGTNYSYENQDDYTPVQIVLVGYANGSDKNATPIYTCTVTIVSFFWVNNGGFIFSPEDYDLFFGSNIYPYAVYFDDAKSAASLYSVGEELGFYSSSLYFKSVYTVKGIVEIFRGMFAYIGLAIALVSFLLIVSYSLRALRRKRREIGILRAIGSRTKQIVWGFVWQVILLGVIVAIISCIALPMLSKEINTAIVTNMANFVDNPAINGLTVLSPNFISLIVVLGIFVPLLVLSSVVPLLFIRRIKPMKIIRSSD